MSFDWQMPKDPFADDPNDPASFIEDDEEALELTDEERVQVTQDLELIHQFKKALAPRGILGIFFICDDCNEPHYYDWDIMAANMRATLGGELAPVHEPSAQPTTEAYVPWDYCLGYLDGLEAPRF